MNNLYVLDNVLTDYDCDEILYMIKNSTNFKKIDNPIAQYFRMEYYSKNLSEYIFDKIKILNLKDCVLIDPNFRISKYQDGMSFNIHRDGKYTLLDLKSKFTINIFLNDNYDGGETCFYENDNLVYIVKPKKGTATIFDGNIYHKGNIVKNGEKYLIRSDIMGIL